MSVQIVNTDQYRMTNRYIQKVKKLISYMYDVIFIMQPEMYLYTQEGMHTSQIEIIWRRHATDKMSYGIYYLINNESINCQIICIKHIFNNMVSESERFADSPFHALIQF